MKLERSSFSTILRLLTLALACVALPGLADDYADISQLLRANKFPEAMTLVDSKLVAKPADPQLRFLKGVTQRNMGKQAEAISTFTKLTQDYPELPEPYNNLAVLYAAQGQYDKARTTLEMAIRTNPSYATAYENLGDVYARLASQSYNKALLLDNSNTAIPPKLTVLREMFKPAAGASAPAANKPVPTASAGAAAH
jgi:tetratricopeptide (TPR) repeat protein